MKKTFLLFGLFVGISAVGQNNDLQDIQKLIKDRQAKDAQAKKPSSPQLGFLSPDTSPEYFLLPNGDVVVYGNGSMPIVKADMRIFTQMPNSASHQIPRTMPNGALRNGFYDLGATGPNSIMDQLAPSPVLENLLKKYGK